MWGKVRNRFKGVNLAHPVLARLGGPALGVDDPVQVGDSALGKGIPCAGDRLRLLKCEPQPLLQELLVALLLFGGASVSRGATSACGKKRIGGSDECRGRSPLWTGRTAWRCFAPRGG